MPTVTYKTPSGQVVTSDLNAAPPQIQTLYNQNYLQPQANLAQTQAGAAVTSADIPGAQARSTTAGIQAKQAGALQGLKKDLSNKMTLGSAISKYTALGMSADDIFKNYLTQNTWGPNNTPKLPVESITQLQQMGISPQALGITGTGYAPNSFADKWNTKNAIQEVNKLQDLWNKTNALGRIFGRANPATNAYDSYLTIVGDHLSSLIPGASGAQATGEGLLKTLPDPSNLGEITGNPAGQFDSVRNALLQSKGYTAKELGLELPSSSNTGKDLLNSLIQAAVPTVGAVGGGALGGLLGGAIDIPTGAIPGAVAGGVAGATAGGAGGQALADLLTGKKPGMDVAMTGALSGVGEGAGAVIGKGLGLLGKTLAPKVSDSVFNKVVADSPSYAPNVQALKNTAEKYGLMDGTSSQGLQIMPQIMNNLGKTIQSKLENVSLPADLSNISNNILKEFEKNSSAFNNTIEFKNAQKYILDRLYSGTGNDTPISQLVDATGKPMVKTGSQTSYANLYQLKSEVANDLSKVFKAEANPASTYQLTPKDEANLALWNGLKNAIDKVSPEVRQLNDDQHNMFDIAKGFVRDANSAKGGSFAGDVFDILAGNMLGGPVGGLAGLIGGKAIRSEGGRMALNAILNSGKLSGLLKGLGSGAGAVTGAGVNAGNQ